MTVAYRIYRLRLMPKMYIDSLKTLDSDVPSSDVTLLITTAVRTEMSTTPCSTVGVDKAIIAEVEQRYG